MWLQKLQFKVYFILHIINYCVLKCNISLQFMCLLMCDATHTSTQTCSIRTIAVIYHKLQQKRIIAIEHSIFILMMLHECNLITSYGLTHLLNVIHVHKGQRQKSFHMYLMNNWLIRKPQMVYTCYEIILAWNTFWECFFHVIF